jgi:hypothetical protein
VTVKIIPVPGRNIELTVSIAKGTPDCTPTPLTLAWFTDQSGAFTEQAEAVQLLPNDAEGPAGPVLAVAGLLGETCGSPITWSATWTPDAGGGAPGWWEDGARLVVWPRTETAPGHLTVQVEVDGHVYGPIVLAVTRYECSASACTPNLTGLSVNQTTVALLGGNFFSDAAIRVTGDWCPDCTAAWSFTGSEAWTRWTQDVISPDVLLLRVFSPEPPTGEVSVTVTCGDLTFGPLTSTLFIQS